MRLQIDQVFGPVVGIQAVDDMVEAQKIINASKYGLEACVFTQDEATIAYM
jgi:acyl-CoA reductase-like NAD-dependent aldehyde dehydrogenase